MNVWLKGQCTRKRRRRLVVFAIAAVCACDASTEPQQIEDRVDPSWVVGEAASALNGLGQFEHAVPPLDGSTLEIPYDVAREQATAWLKTFAPSIVSSLSTQRGEPVELSTLALCSRGFYARRAYEEIDPVHPLPIRRIYGPTWLLTFCSEGLQVVSLAVSAYNTDVTVENGLIRLAPLFTGGEFKSQGVPLVLSQLPMSAERAVRLAFELTGMRVASVPELHMPQRPTASHASRWRVVLETPVTFMLESDSSVIQTAELWIGKSREGERELSVAVGDIPTSVSNYQLIDPATGQLGSVISVSVSPRAGRLKWETARVLPLASLNTVDR